MKEMVLALDELDKICEILPKNGVVILQGDLASGKTSLVKALAAFRQSQIIPTSPTFCTMQEYLSQEGKIYHYDIYQEGFEKLLKNGLIENFFEQGLHLVEWGDEKLKKYLDRFEIPNLMIKITPQNYKRKYEIYE
ncbi:tRNA (adenosine(37)-N6)-threonylcarbamoyltransferase complex ATPase subunit type 1 TsaE [Campylobacter sp. US33a]|uniref:tRNA (Adenosine(37)-N6)-threonylcarbamoyltransferase complex ATPase subunit type 1 TsaE n=1 Tax=Campylobacter sp. CCS1377 TaxID=3158229 RepID=A0AAU7E610_9BACT|nr:tRNA (adenosine(37)-N6)-threonylcarbamoyltransferase complex ATPase subunit type 1 TsaE [Campylobacter sp. US33a]TEY03411.1 tRNA (adenosine(37)-N6)-threonylcarbamoyltransferase complex ATPase subunit type 1 TsaE [Campylobacter sp. US33a]